MQELRIMNKLIKDNRDGFTLIEIMIAVTVLAIGILGIAKMQLGAVRGNSYARGLTEASTLAQNKMEELMFLAYDDPALDDVPDSNNKLDGTKNSVDVPNGIAKDNDNDGIDDTGNNFGLDDTANPDGTEPYIGQEFIYQYTISWNIAINEPVTDSKRIRVHVLWRQNGVNRRLTLNAVKVVT